MRPWIFGNRSETATENQTNARIVPHFSYCIRYRHYVLGDLKEKHEVRFCLIIDLLATQAVILLMSNLLTYLPRKLVRLD